MDRLAPAQGAPRRTLSVQGRGRVPTPEHQGWTLEGVQAEGLGGLAGTCLSKGLGHRGCTRRPSGARVLSAPGVCRPFLLDPLHRRRQGPRALTLPSCPSDDSVPRPPPLQRPRFSVPDAQREHLVSSEGPSP